MLKQFYFKQFSLEEAHSLNAKNSKLKKQLFDSI